MDLILTRLKYIKEKFQRKSNKFKKPDCYVFCCAGNNNVLAYLISKLNAQNKDKYGNKGCDWPLNSKKPFKCLVYKPTC